MGAVWGISRTVAEVHALLFITGESLCTDDVMKRLAISRGNASMSLRNLLEWGIISRVHKRGDRKDYYQAEQDVWAMFRAIVRERLKREVDPLLTDLDDLIATSDKQPSEDLRERLTALREFFELVSTLGHRFAGPTGHGLEAAAKLLSRTPASQDGKRGRP